MKKLIYSFIVLLTAIGMSGCGDDLDKDLEGTWTYADASGVHVLSFYGDKKVLAYTSDEGLNIKAGTVDGEYEINDDVIILYGNKTKYTVTTREKGITQGGVTYNRATLSGITLKVYVNNRSTWIFTKH